MSSLPKMKPILPWWQLGLLLALCGLAIYQLVPDDPRLIDNLIRDRNPRDARRQLEKVSPAKRANDPVRYLRLEVEIARLELRPDDRAALDAFARRGVAAWRESRYAPSILALIAPALAQLRDPAALWPELEAAVLAAPEKARAIAGERLATAALASSQPATAAQIYASTHPEATRTAAQRLEIARLRQLAGQPAEALAALGEEQSEEARALRLLLLRELNRNREALTLLLNRAAASAKADVKLVADIATVALQAGAPAEAIPAVRSLLAAQPDDVATWRQLRTLHVSAGDPAGAVEAAQRAAALSERGTDDLRELARIHEYAGQPGPAFDTWLEIALRSGDVPAVERLIALNPGLFRDVELARALNRVVPLPGRDDLTLRLARLEVMLGSYDNARTHFEQYLALRPEADVMIEYAHLHRELYRFGDAETWLRRAAELRPDNLGLRREIAECLVYQGRNKEALAIYAELAQRDRSPEVLDPFTRLAETLGDYEAFARALRQTVETATTPDVRDYKMLAYAYELNSRSDLRRATLEAGLKVFPKDDDLRMSLASALADARLYREAQSTLALHTKLREDPLAAELFLELMRLNNDTAAERRFLRETFSPAVLEDEDFLMHSAYAWEALREYPRAEAIHRQLQARHPANFQHAGDLARIALLRGHPKEAKQVLAPFLAAPTPAVLKLAAEIASSAGDHRNAEKYQAAYLSAMRNASATDWGALGDIRLSRGDRIGAKRAYAEALRRMHAELGTNKGGGR